jgi:Ala-tRNA(Pro) deacylase
VRVQDFLHDQNVSFETLSHGATYSAQTLAQAVHVHGDEVAKTVLLRVDDGFVLAVLPATRSLNMHDVRTVLGAEHVKLATEEECGAEFTDCELGAIPPFGSQYGIRTLMDESLLEDEDIVFESNTHDEAIRMSTKIYVDLEQPMVGKFSHHV